MKIKLDKKLLKSLALMAAVVEARDTYTGGHLWRVSNISRLLAEKMGMSTAEVYHVSLGGFLHDLGKVGIPDAILNKRGPLTKEEFTVVKTHPVLGEALIQEHPLGILATTAVRYHHEWVNGNGYPDGLTGSNIPLHARIVSMADAFDAMTSTRPYRVGMTISKALADLESVRSIQFDNDILSTLNALASIGSLDNIVGYSDWQIPMVKCPECGPVMAVPRAAKDGDLIYCRSCKNELRLEKDGESFVTCSACPTGRTAPADKVQPQTDSASLEDFIHMAPRKLTINLNINRNRFG
jgi:hypothetical protein